jgi:hypothetical protein
VILQRAMLALLTKILLALRSLLEVPASREAEILVLRQQLLVLSRKSPRHADYGISIARSWSGCPGFSRR